MAFAREGAALLLVDVDGDSLRPAAQACGEAGAAQVLLDVTDVSSRHQVESSIRRAMGALGRVDVLVNNAATFEPPTPFEEIDDTTWDWILSVNVMGVINGCRAVIPIMKEQRWGRIINASSMYGIAPQVHRAPYCVSKAAVNTITRVLAAELGPYGITVNAYAPGTIRTRMAGDAVTGSRAEAKLRGIPVGRFGEPDDVASVILFLASEEAVYVTGTILSVDGGTLSVKNPERIWGRDGLPLRTDVRQDGHGG
jgi:3-oxoacyl-[acyl-carrier protein] reductase